MKDSAIKKKENLKLGPDIYSLAMYSFYKDSIESLDNTKQEEVNEKEQELSDESSSESESSSSESESSDNIQPLNIIIEN